jgi:hypothetical protein
MRFGTWNVRSLYGAGSLKTVSSDFFFKDTVVRGPLAYPNGLLDLHIETYGRTYWPGDQPDARPLPTQDNTTQKHADAHTCPK